MDETLPTAWPDIIQQEGAREQVVGRRAPQNGGSLLKKKNLPHFFSLHTLFTAVLPHE